ncbi:hypothetical protein [Eastern grey kangaroopox virus]|uniref:Uncharacterized protein n=1 Tax=Eastern grey kangaroopox virus TaxID=2042482 RepID=A0A2C9DTA1_9POXV|nr:hypothetical protein KM541_gp138 [Eastern grey kangaroopox virus]ATI21234.1 hypothetical protein [Eastern grey kangaroopox virus]AXK50184.1 hypothetical protein EKPV-NSW-ORF154 [Eastern grey kangaroopox virus]
MGVGSTVADLALVIGIVRARAVAVYAAARARCLRLLLRLHPSMLRG